MSIPLFRLDFYVVQIPLNPAFNKNKTCEPLDKNITPTP